MTKLTSFLLCIFIASLVQSCQKPLDPPDNIIAAGSLIKDGSGNCLPVNINGIYRINTALNATNYMDVSVDVTAAGDYEIFTDIINGIHFGDSAQFTGTGIQVVRLKGYGTPVNAGTFPFTVHFGSLSSCAVAVTVSASTTPPASFTLTGAPGSCTTPLIQGSYNVGTTLNTSNKVVIAANVTSPGDYTLSTAVVNGISFSAAGTFTGTGNQSITLSGSGTPLTAGTNSMMVTGTASSCSFPLTVDAVVIPDPAKLILIATKEANPGSQNTTSLTCYNFDKTIKWQRNNLGNQGYRRNGYPSNPLYANGVVFFSEDSLFTVGANYYTMNNFYAIDVNTGNNIWTKRSQTEFIQFPVINNGIVYCNFQQGTTQNIAAFNATNGALLWMAPIAEANGADNLTVDGNTLYFFSVATPSQIFINAFDLATRTLKWKLPLGANYFRNYTAMAIEGPLLYVQNAAGKIMALDKTTGASAWSTTNTGYSPPQIANNLLYTTDAAHNYNALDPATGVRNLFWTANVGLASRPYIDGPNMYVFGIDSAGNNFVTSFNAVTTGVNWRRNAADLYENPVVTGNTIYAIENNYASGASRIVMFDSNSGTYQDAITITPWEFGEIRIITVAGKFIHPY